ncbi:MAG: LamG domain-containing protein, partial [Anaerolineales bacterium]|nr:LamG domain-containing protein [Anaerolineales bacterium]
YSMGIGRYGAVNSHHFNGSIDEVMIFNTSLSAQQIQNIYNNQSARFTSQGSQTLKQFNITSGNDTINVTTKGFQTTLGSELEVRVGEWDVSRGYNDTYNGSIVATDGLVGYWHFDNVSGMGENDTLAIDWSGEGNNGTAIGGMLYNVSGYYGGAWRFDGVDDYVSVPTTTVNISRNFSVSLWVNKDSGKVAENNDRMISFVDGADDGFQFIFDHDTGNYGALLERDGINVISGLTYGTYDADIWVHLTYVVNGSTGTLYRNGVVRASDGATGISTGNTQNYFIGMRGDQVGSTEFDGVMDEVMIFNRSLSATEITELYIKGRANWNHTTTGPHQNVSATTTDNKFTISTSTTNLLPEYRFSPGNGTEISQTNSFYSPILGASTINPINFEYDLEGLPPDINFTIMT